jgi:four helix bundle suffix protein
MELKLTNVARSSLEELRRDYEDFLRQRKLPQWERNDPRRADLIARRPATADDVARWARDVKSGQCGLHGQQARAAPSTPSMPSTPSTSSTPSTPSTPPTYAEIAANGALVLIAVACTLLDRQLAAQAEAFRRDGGFTERLYRHRRRNREQS